MQPRGYVELHLHTAFSLLDGASLPEEMIDRAAELDYQALAVTDHNGLYGAMEFAQAAKAANIQPITGAEITLTDGTHLTLLAETSTGYANLCRLITAAYRWESSYQSSQVGADPVSARGPGSINGRAQGPPLPENQRVHAPEHRHNPQLNPDLLPEFAGGLILLTGCRQGKLAQLVDAGDLSAAEDLLHTWIDWFGKDNVYVELQQNLVHGDTRRVHQMVRLAKKVGLPYVATGNVHYHRRERHQLQDVLVAIRHKTMLDGAHQFRRPNCEFDLQPAEQVAVRFASYPEALDTTLEIAERCAKFDLTTDLDYAFPDHPTEAGESQADVLERLCREAMETRYPPGSEFRERAEDRLQQEMGLITKHKLAGFFLLYQDLMRLAAAVAEEVRGPSLARSHSMLPPGRGRGSSVGSIVCYLIGLSHVDPLKHNLFLGRFLNEDLASVPDIDLDFPRDIRERLIERVYEVYGHDHAALVSAFSTYRLRSAVRDIGKALGLPATDIDKIAKMSEGRSAKDLGEELDRIPAYASRRETPPLSYLVELADQLAGFPRHVSQHSGGMVISSTPLIDLVPVQPSAMEGRYICHWDKDSCDDARFIKIDFLALGMLSLVEECLELIVESGKDPIDLSQVELDDPKVYDAICKGDTVGIFQIESRAQIQMLTRTKPRCLEDLVVQVAIVRPGPIVGGAVNPYVQNRQRKLLDPDFEPHYDHPSLKPVLEETLGVILYQEQVLEVSMYLAGFSAGQADQLRKAMSRKRSKEAMLQIWDRFRDGALARGVDIETAKHVFRKLMAFAQYGFPKSHSAAFTVLSYQSAWLRHYYAAEFMCALFNNQPMGFYAPHVLVNDAKRHGVRVWGPHINDGRAKSTVHDGNAVRIGFGYVKAMSEDSAQLIEQERDTNGPFQSLADFVRRVPVKREAVENLVLVGAFDCFGLGRREALWQLGLFIPARGYGKAGKAAKQQPLPLPVEQDMVELSPMAPWEQMAADYNTLGLSPRYHPMGLLRPHLPKEIVTSTDLRTLPDGSQITIAGLIVCRQRPGTAKNITFLLMEDELGLSNIIVYPYLYEQDRLLVRREPFVLVRGKLQRQHGTINVIAEHLEPLDTAREHYDAPAPESINLDAEPGDPVSMTRTVVSPKAHNFH
jgi:error-prone DNA polymerase